MKKGFTVVELLMGTSIFLILLGGGVGSLVSSLRIQRMIFAHQGVATELNYVVEYMSRSLRMAQKEGSSAECLTEGSIYEVSENKEKITFTNHLQDNDCQSFKLDSGTLYLVYEDTSEEVAMTSPDIEIENLVFEVDQVSQPKVTFVIKANSSNLRTPLDIQTTVSARALNVGYEQ